MNNADLQSKSSCVENKILEGVDKFSKCLSKDIEQCSTNMADKFIDLFLLDENVYTETCTEPASLETLHQNYANDMVSIVSKHFT